MEREDAQGLVDLIRGQRWAALASSREDRPLASMVAYATLPELTGFLLHLSGLAAHTANLQAVGRASLVISQADTGEGDPQQLPRVSISGPVTALQAGDGDYAACKSAYLARLPGAEPRFGFADFQLFLLSPEKVNYVGGFANARNLTEAAYRAVLRSAL